MNKQDIQLLYEHNSWINARILTAASGITQEQFQAPGAFPRGGLRATLVHALFAEWIWRMRRHGTQHRTEAAAMLTDIGHSPGDIDLIVYLKERRS